MNSADLDRLAELEAKATKGEWRWGSGNWCVWEHTGANEVMSTTLEDENADLGDDMQFIAALRNAAPELLRLAAIGLKHDK